MCESCPKIITFYLPQFHKVTENDKWWGEGFTDWESAKRAIPFFDGHYQPRIPLAHNYYDLLDKAVIIKQYEMMEKYGVYGQCFYHYWFKDGRQILEKPAENLLTWKDISMPFCFCWPVESWARTWSGMNNTNSWSAVLEKKSDINSDGGILLEQDFGGREEWKKHFEYLLPFFEDERYIKIDGKPIFLIHKLELMDCTAEMRDCWQSLAKEAGIPGIYMIGSYARVPDDGGYHGNVDAYYYHEPLHARQLSITDSWNEGLRCLDYDKIWKIILEKYFQANDMIYPGAFVDYDNTPRMGNAGSLFYGPTPEKFGNYLSRLVWLVRKKKQEFIFLNAWNEWGEGMYLEPDEKYGFAYLEAFHDALKNPQEYEDQRNDGQILENEIEKLKTVNKRYRGYFKLLDQWLTVNELGGNITAWFEKHSISNIAIYGTGMMARHLIEELRESAVNIFFGIDRQSVIKHFDFPVYDMRQEWPEESQVDVIVVTTTYDNEEIEKKIRDRSDKLIVELTSIIGEIGSDAG